MLDFRRSMRFLLTAGLFSLMATSAFAQGTGLFGGKGPVSGSNGMSNGTSGLSSAGLSGLNGLGQSGFGGSSGVVGGTSGLGSTQFGIGGGSLSGTNGGFVGRSDSAGRFVGSGMAGGQGTTGGMRGRGFQSGQFGRGATSRGFGATGQQGFMQQGGAMGTENAAAGAARLLHPQQRIAFTYKQPGSAAASKSLATRFGHLASRPALKGVSGLKFDVDGNVLTLRGTVDSEETKRLVGMLAGLEPGVGRVHNDLTIDTNLPRAPGVAPPK